MVNTIESRTTKNIVDDLLQFVYGHEWVEQYFACGMGCCGEWKTICPSCGADQGIYRSENYQKHESDCKLAALIKEAEAYVIVENEIERLGE